MFVGSLGVPLKTTRIITERRTLPFERIWIRARCRQYRMLCSPRNSCLGQSLRHVDLVSWSGENANQPADAHFVPFPVTIVVLSRFVYRKGIDLLIATIPQICALHPDVSFLVGGDGPKRVELEQMRERYFLQDRVEMVGAVPFSSVRDVSEINLSELKHLDQL
jgi:glycosyltransferase involved in cell wall biosynthesis